MKWGTTDVYYFRGTYRPPSVDAGIVEIPLLPGNGKNSVLQQSGPGRKRISWRGFTTSLSAYNTLMSDYTAGTSKTFTGPGGVSLSCIIESLSPPEYIDDLVRYEITLMEA